MLICIHPYLQFHMQMYMFFLRKHNLIKIITILNNNYVHIEYVVVKKKILCYFLCKYLGRL